MYEILFQYGPLTVATFNLLLAAGFVVSMIFLARFIQLKKLKLSFFVNHFATFLIAPLIGGRLLYIFEHFSVIRQDPLQAIAVWDMKLSAFGFLYTFLGALYYFTRKDGEDFWGWFDAFVLTGLVGLIFIHIGHFFNGTHYGVPTTLPWGIAFDTFTIQFIKPIHPVQIYSAIISFAILGILMRIVKRTHLTGVAGSIGVMLYSLTAFGIDFLHGVPSSYAKGTFLILSATGFIAYIQTSHKKQLSKG